VPLALLVLLFVVVPLAELWVILAVGDAIGVVPTVILLAADSVLGAVLLRSQGRAVWTRFTEAWRAGRLPHREVLDGVLVIFGGAFLITPGFLTDLIGLALLLPPTRAVVRRILAGTLLGRAGLALGAVEAVRERRRKPGADVEGSATDIHHEPPPRGQLPR